MTEETMTEERTPNFDKQSVVMLGPDPSGIEGPKTRSVATDNTGSWVFFTDVTRIGNGYNVTVTGISDSHSWFWVYATDYNDKRLTWEWCSNNKQVTLKCDPSNVSKILVAWQDGHLGGWINMAYTHPSWWG